jgi:arginyl-tRNA synthetase
MNYKNLETFLTNLFEQVFEKLGFDVKSANVVVSNRPDLCQFQCNGALAIGKMQGKNPMDVAMAIRVAVLGMCESGDVSIDFAGKIFKSIEVCKPGFLNIVLTDEFLAGRANELVDDERFGCEKIELVRAVVDYGGPNVAKNMHVGHLRSGVVGNCIYRLMKFVGYDVVGDVHLGDWGTQMGMLIEAVRKMDSSLPYFDEKFVDDYPKASPVTMDDLERMYPEASALCKRDEEEATKARVAVKELQDGRRGYRALWRHFVDESVKSMKANYKDLGIEFDLWNGESDVQYLIPEMVKDLISRGVAKESQGAMVVDVLPMEGGQEVPPMILVKSDGSAIYATTDLATIKERVEKLGAKEIIYVIDQRQSLHFYQLFSSAKKAGYVDDVKLEFVGFGTINGKDGKPFRTRSGGAIKLKDLIEMAKEAVMKRLDSIEEDGRKFDDSERDKLLRKIAIATIKFADLINNRISGYVFDIEKFASFEGKTGPYLLYSAVRIKSILRKAREAGVEVSEIVLSDDTERELMILIDQLPKYINKALMKKEPHHLCDYVFNLAQAFSRFYQTCHILNEEDEVVRGSRLALAGMTLGAMELVFGILGIEAPERM